MILQLQNVPAISLKCSSIHSCCVAYLLLKSRGIDQKILTKIFNTFELSAARLQPSMGSPFSSRWRLQTDSRKLECIKYFFQRTWHCLREFCVCKTMKFWKIYLISLNHSLRKVFAFLNDCCPLWLRARPRSSPDYSTGRSLLWCYIRVVYSSKNF